MGGTSSTTTTTTAKTTEIDYKMKFLIDALICREKWDIDALYIPEMELNIDTEVDRLKTLIDEKVYLFYLHFLWYYIQVLCIQNLLHITYIIKTLLEKKRNMT